jgi:integrase/recombinase XerD
MGTLRKRKGKWIVDFRLPLFLANKYGCARFKRGYSKYAVAKDVHEIVSHAIANRDKEGKLAALLNWGEAGITVKKFYERWIKEYVTPRLEASTKKRYELSFKSINSFCGNVQLASFSRENLYQFIQSRGGVVSPSTVNKDIIAIKKMFSYAFEIGKIENNPLVRFPALRVQEKARRIPTIEQFHALIKAIEDPALSAMIVVIGECGLRRSEAINLEWKNVNLGAARITLEKTKGKRVRSLPLSQFALAALRGITRFIGESRVFCHQLSGQRWVSPDKAFREGRGKAKLEWVTFHTLRHFWADRMVMAGADIQSIKEGLGHSDIRTTDIYTKHARNRSEEVLRAAQISESAGQERLSQDGVKNGKP